MSEAKFNEAVKIVQGLPKEGPVKPSQEDQLYVRIHNYTDYLDLTAISSVLLPL